MTVALRTLRPLERCVINGYECEVTRQARRTTFVRIRNDWLPGRPVVQLSNKIMVRPSAQPPEEAS